MRSILYFCVNVFSQRFLTRTHIPLINYFCDTYANDVFIFNYINQKYYSNFLNKELKIVDLPFIFEQASSPVKI